MKKKIAIVVQRYGLEVNGGAEYHARMLAEKLTNNYDVDVLTSTALDYHGWKNHYKSGKDIVNGINVYRFSTKKKNEKRTRKARRAIHKRKKYFKILNFFGVFEFFERKYNITRVTQKDINNWIAGQGPYCPDLLKFISNNSNNYDAFIFFTYLYYPTVCGMPLVKEKSIFIPTAHDEPLLYTKPYENLFSIPKFIMYNTDSEKNLVESHFENYTKKYDIAGVGIEKYHGNYVENPFDLEEKKYFIYVGRIDEAKGCKIMLENFLEFYRNFTEYKNFKLVLVGKNFLKKKYEHPSIIYSGFIDEDLKYSLIKNSLAMIMPSFYESLSLVTLEAMSEKVPVIVNKNCDVLYQHIIKSDSGDFYNSYDDFKNILLKYINKNKTELEIEGEKAQIYVNQNYTWEKVLEKFDKAIKFIMDKE